MQDIRTTTQHAHITRARRGMMQGISAVVQGVGAGYCVCRYGLCPLPFFSSQDTLWLSYALLHYALASHCTAMAGGGSA